MYVLHELLVARIAARCAACQSRDFEVTNRCCFTMTDMIHVYGNFGGAQVSIINTCLAEPDSWALTRQEVARIGENCPFRSLRSPPRALPTGTNVVSATSQSNSETTVDLVRVETWSSVSTRRMGWRVKGEPATAPSAPRATTNRPNRALKCGVTWCSVCSLTCRV